MQRRYSIPDNYEGSFSLIVAPEPTGLFRMGLVALAAIRRRRLTRGSARRR
jgi:hypothetical protein